MKTIFPITILALTLFSCNNSSKKDEEHADNGSGNIVPDSAAVLNSPNTVPLGRGPVIDDAEAKKRRDILYMGIDSTYFAIHQIESIKNEIVDESSVRLSVTERNIKSKAIRTLNTLQNSLAMQVDSSLLTNLKLHTRQLAEINSTITSNVIHLKDISAKISKAADIMNRITGVLTYCVSKGIIKPPTPPGSSASEVKATVK